MKRLIVFASLGLAVTGCKSSKTYESTVTINRVDGVRHEAGVAKDVDVEFDWSECPGEQVEVIRGDKDFAACMKKYKAGDKVPVKVDFHWENRGYWDWDITEMGGCKRPPDPDDNSSFDTVQECEPIVSNGVNEGFICSRIPNKALLKKCPWFARH